LGQHGADALPDGFFDLLEDAHLDLAHALARDPELVRQRVGAMLAQPVPSFRIDMTPELRA
jgi:hypothetical protein